MSTLSKSLVYVIRFVKPVWLHVCLSVCVSICVPLCDQLVAIASSLKLLRNSVGVRICDEPAAHTTRINNITFN